MLGVNVNKTWQRSPESPENVPNASPLRTEWFLLFLMHWPEYERGFPAGLLEGVRCADSIKKKQHYMVWRDDHILPLNQQKGHFSPLCEAEFS